MVGFGYLSSPHDHLFLAGVFREEDLPAMKCETCANSGKPGYVKYFLAEPERRSMGPDRVAAKISDYCVCPYCHGSWAERSYPEVARSPHTDPA